MAMILGLGLSKVWVWDFEECMGTAASSMSHVKYDVKVGSSCCPQVTSEGIKANALT